jgi:hypothetical protein
MATITSAKTIQDAAAIHCRYWNRPAWEAARKIRDRIIDREDPEWPNSEFWSEVDKISPDPRNA